MQHKTRQLTRYCPTCIQIKPMAKLRPSMITKRKFAEKPFSKTHFDLVDYRFPDSAGKRYLLSAMCSLTGFLDGIPLTRKTDEAVAKQLLNLILTHGITGDAITDNGKELSGPLVKEIFKRFEIRHSTTTAYRSQSNGQLERVHREIHLKLKSLNASNKNWSTAWPMSKYFINNLPKESLDGLSANEAYYGRSCYGPNRKTSETCCS